MTSRFRISRSTFFAATALTLFAMRPAAGDEAGLPVVAPPAEAKIDFAAQVLPLLRTNCLACHSATVKEGDLSLESPAPMRTGGTSGPAIVPGKGEESLLFRVAAHRVEPTMPPADNDAGAKNLSPEALGLLRAWIDQGAEGSTGSPAAPIAWQALDASFGPIYAADVTADGRYAAAARGNRVLLFDVVSKREIDRLVDPALASSDLYKGAEVADLDAVQSLAFSRDGLRIATGGFRTVRIWKREEGAAVRDLAAGEIDSLSATAPVAAPAEFVASYGPAVEGIVLSTDANLVVFAGIDGTARLWNLAAKAQVREFGHGAPLTSVAIRRDGKRLATAAIDGSIVVWDLDSGARIAEASRDSATKLREAELRHAIEVARLRERTAKSDLDAAAKREREEAAVADAAELFAAETRLAAKRKATDAEKPVAEKDAVEKTLAEAEAAFVATEAAKQTAEKNRIAASEALVATRKQRDAGAVDDAAVKSAEETEKAAVEAEKQATTALAEATKKRDDAKREADRLGPIAQKAIDERNVAEGGAKTAEREAGVAKEVVAKTLASLPGVEAEWKSRSEARRTREAELASLLAEQVAARARLQERTASAATMLKETGALKQALGAAPPAAPSPSAESLAAKEKAAPDLAAAGAAFEAKLLAVWSANASKRATFDAMLAAKRAADEALNRTNELVQAATSRKEAADMALADAKAKQASAANDEAKLQSAASEHAKELRQLGVAIAERNSTAATEALADATAAKTDAETKKVEQDKAAEASNADAMRAVEEASKALAEARSALGAALAAALAAEEAAGGSAAVLALRERLLSDARASLGKERPAIRDVAFSHEGDRMAAVDEAGQVRLFHAETGELLTAFSPEGKTATAVAFDAEGRLAIASSDGTARLHESVPVWRVERTIGDPSSTTAFVDRVTALEFDSTGMLLATGGGEPSRSGELKLWNVETGELVRDFAGAHSDTVFDVAFSSDGAALASCGADRFVKTFDARTGDLLRSLEGHTHHVLSVDWRADDRLLATGSADQTIKIWDVRLGEQIRTIQGLAKEAPSLRFLGASDEFIVAVGDAQVAIRNVGGGSGATFLTPEDFAYVVRASADGQRVLAGGQDGTLRIWDRAAKPVAEFATAPMP